MNAKPWSFARRVMRRVRKLATDCWRWTGAKTADGYGKLEVGGKSWKAHRYVWTELVGPIPEGHELDHLLDRCVTRACVAPHHPEPVDRQTHLRRQAERTRARRAQT